MKEKLPKWLLSCLIVIFLLAFFPGVYLIFSTQQDVEDQNKQYLNEIAAQNAQGVKRVVDMQLDHLESLANLIGKREPFSIEFTMQQLTEESERAAFKRLAYVPPDGNVIATDHVSFNVLDRAYYQRTLQGKNSVSDLMTDKIGGEEINVYAVPFFYQGKQQAVLIATKSSAVFSDVLAVKVFGGEGLSYLVKANGAPVAYSHTGERQPRFDNLFDALKDNGMSEEGLEKIREDMEQGAEGTLDYSNNGMPMVGNYTAVGVNDWYVLTLLPRALISANSDRVVARTISSVVVTILLLAFLLLLIILQNKKAAKRLEHLAFSDPLTGGNNLNQFKRLAAQCIDKKRGSYFLARLDIDNFKLINDMYGFTEGDYVLLHVDRLIRELLSTEDIYGRASSDNFLALIGADSVEKVIELGTQFRETFRQLLNEQGKMYSLSFTTGVYPIPAHEMGENIDTFIDRATMAHRDAKTQQSGRKFSIYSDSIRDTAIRVKQIEDNMQKALSSGEFIIYLQPKYNLETGKMEGAEALARWKSDGQILAPAAFIPVFERNGFIVNLDLYILEEVCRLQRKWIDEGLSPLPISVNQSKPLVYSKDYVKHLYNTINKYQLPPRLVELELLETLIHDNILELEETVAQLRAYGFLICIDDFGSGYSSLNMLKDISADVLKIDRAFLSSAESNQRAEWVLRNIINLAKGLHMSVVAEGVETQMQAKLLRELGSDTAQGFLFAKPMPVIEFKKKLEENAEIVSR